MADTNQREKLNEEDQLLVQQAPTTKDASYRAADMSIIDPDALDTDYGTDTMSKASQKDDRNKQLQPIRDNEIGLMSMKMNPNSQIQDMWNAVNDTVMNLPNVDPISDEKFKRLFGNVYQAGSYCEFLVGLYNAQQGGPVLDFKRLCGDGFAMDSFFRSVKDGLRNCKDIVHEADVEIEEDADDVFDAYSSDEEDDTIKSEDEKYLRPNGFLQLSYDPNLVKTWIEKIKTRHIEDKNHMMGLMAHNAQHAENLEIIVREGDKDLVALCQKMMSTTNNAALARNTTALLKQLVQTDLQWDADFLECLFEAMVFWVPNNDRRGESKAFEITESRETVMNLVDTLYLMKEKQIFTEDEIEEQANNGFKADDSDQSKETSDVEILRIYLETLSENEAKDSLAYVLGLF